jgi:hypothetical protein
VGAARDAWPVASEDALVTAEDVVELNRASIARAGALARGAGSVLVAVGVVGAVAWLWTAARQQQLVDSGGGDGGLAVFGPPSEELSFVERLDLFASTIGFLLTAALLTGVGFLLRLVADYSVGRTGTSLTGFEVGDRLPDDET